MLQRRLNCFAKIKQIENGGGGIVKQRREERESDDATECDARRRSGRNCQNISDETHL